jgi:hypothetical protein
MNIFRDQCRYFTVPQQVVRSGILRDLSRAALALYLFFVDYAQRYNVVRFEIASYTIDDYIGIDPSHIPAARRQLADAGLITFQQNRRNRLYTYELLNPVTKQPLPVPEGKRGFREHKPRADRNVRSVREYKRSRKRPAGSPILHPPSWDDIVASSEREPGEDEAAG